MWNVCLQEPQDSPNGNADGSSSHHQSAVSSHPPSSSAPTLPLKCSIETCDKKFAKMKQVIDHLNADQYQNLTGTSVEFITEAAFDEWLHSTQRDNICTFVKGTRRVDLSGTVSYYYCSRSGSSKPSVPTSERKRDLKVQGYTKINRTCPAHIIQRVHHDGVVSVKYYSKHLCYTDVYEQLGHIRLPASDRQWLAGKLALQVPIEVILREVRKKLDGQLQRLHIVTKKDICNIERAFHLNRPERHHTDDATSVSAIVQMYSGEENSPILAYRCQGASA